MGIPKPPSHRPHYLCGEGLKRGVRTALAWVVALCYLAALFALWAGVEERAVAGLLIFAVGALGLRSSGSDE